MTSRSAALAVSVFLAATALPALAVDSASSDTGVSKIRVVRLSEVKGAVKMDRAIGRGMEPAVANMPIVESSMLRTDQGVAEVEFEDNSTLRMAPDTVIKFEQLERLTTGATTSSVRVLRGTAYVSLAKTRGNSFDLKFAKQNLSLEPGSHVRLELEDAQAKLAVLDGNVSLDGARGAEEIARKRTMTFRLADQSEPTMEKQVASEPYDSWDQTATGYHARTAAYSALSSTPYSYGLNDMMYYGSFTDSNGCGSMWRPYFTSAAWDPFSNGSWAYYSGAGYSWVSPYPWGWTPYHYGSWSFCPGAGWGWQPGGGWNGLSNGTSLMASGGPLRFQPPPGRAPRPGESTVMTINLKPLMRSEVASTESFVFRKDSAGLGIPRGELGKLDKLSRQTIERGVASTRIYLTAPEVMGNGRAMNTGLGEVSLHRGYAPATYDAYRSESTERGGSANGRASSGFSGSVSTRGTGSPTPSSGGHTK
jgi:FecR protein